MLNSNENIGKFNTQDAFRNVKKFNTNYQQYSDAIPRGLEEAELRGYILGGLSEDSRNGDMIGYLANTEREQEEGEREE